QGSRRIGQDLPPRVLEDQNTAGSQPGGASKPFQHSFIEIFPVVRRIDKSDVESDVKSIERLSKIHFHDLEPFVDFQRFQILTNELARFSRLIEKMDEGRAAADRFDADGSYSRAPVQKCGAGNADTQDVEERFPELVARRPDSGRRRRFQASAFELAGNDSH